MSIGSIAKLFGGGSDKSFTLQSMDDEEESVRLDAMTSWDLQHSGQTTTHTSEVDDYTDHVHNGPTSISVSGLISDTTLPESIVDSAKAFAGIGGRIANTLSGMPTSTRSQDMMSQLRGMRDKRLLLKVRTSVYSGEDFVIVDLNEKRSPETGSAIEVSLRLTQLNFAKVLSEKDDADAGAAALGAAGTKDAGKLAGGAAGAAGSAASAGGAAGGIPAVDFVAPPTPA